MDCWDGESPRSSCPRGLARLLFAWIRDSSRYFPRTTDNTPRSPQRESSGYIIRCCLELDKTKRSYHWFFPEYFYDIICRRIYEMRYIRVYTYAVFCLRVFQLVFLWSLIVRNPNVERIILEQKCGKMKFTRKLLFWWPQTYGLCCW